MLIIFGLWTLKVKKPISWLLYGCDIWQINKPFVVVVVVFVVVVVDVEVVV